MLFETRAVDNGDSIKDLLHHIDDPMVRPSSTFLVLLHLAAYKLLVDATQSRDLSHRQGVPRLQGLESSPSVLAILQRLPRSKAHVVTGHSATTTFTALCHRWSLRVATERDDVHLHGCGATGINGQPRPSRSQDRVYAISLVIRNGNGSAFTSGVELQLCRWGVPPLPLPDTHGMDTERAVSRSCSSRCYEPQCNGWSYNA